MIVGQCPSYADTNRSRITSSERTAGNCCARLEPGLLIGGAPAVERKSYFGVVNVRTWGLLGQSL